MIEEDIILKDTKTKQGKLFKYSLSDNLEDIKTAIYSRIGQNIKLDNVNWRLNFYTSKKVKHLMNKHNVTYSMTEWEDDESKNKYLVLNMLIDDLLFQTKFCVIKGSYIRSDLVEAFYLRSKGL